MVARGGGVPPPPKDEQGFDVVWVAARGSPGDEHFFRFELLEMGMGLVAGGEITENGESAAARAKFTAKGRGGGK